MKKRIFMNMLFLTMLSLLALSAVLCLVFYYQLSGLVHTELRDLITAFSGSGKQAAIEAFAPTQGSHTRITVIAPDGEVVFDNTVAAGSLLNHGDRQEVRAAVQYGVGESKRFSDTLDRETYYYAVKMSDGYILRAAKTSHSIFGMFAGALPAAACVLAVMLLAAYLVAGGLTRRILAPINSVDLTAGVVAPYDELIPFARMITRQQEKLAGQMQDLKARTDTIEAILGNMSEGIILVDGGGTVLTVNKSAAALIDLPDMAAGRNILELFRDADILEHLRAALGGSRREMNLDRHQKTYRIHFSPVADSGAIILWMDITERMKAEALRREFSANVSHELKTPLTTIYGHAEMLSSGMVREEDRPSFYRRMKDEAARLIALIEDILLISRLDEGADQVSFEEVELSQVLTQTVESLSPKATESRISLELEVQPAILHANRSQMHELCYNLIDNAIKYTQGGGSVLARLAVTDEELQITVADNGIGIPKEAQSRVFERFYRVEQSRSKKGGGTGLGLAIVKHIALVHGGTISLKSEVGKGTEISVCFKRVLV